MGEAHLPWDPPGASVRSQPPAPEQPPGVPTIRRHEEGNVPGVGSDPAGDPEPGSPPTPTRTAPAGGKRQALPLQVCWSHSSAVPRPGAPPCRQRSLCSCSAALSELGSPSAALLGPSQPPGLHLAACLPALLAGKAAHPCAGQWWFPPWSLTPAHALLPVEGPGRQLARPLSGVQAVLCIAPPSAALWRGRKAAASGVRAQRCVKGRRHFPSSLPSPNRCARP